ncbi:MAG TPA: hypothetical protein PKC21_08380 [Oligoflexia bacterium]|nr:hypothetical protein [Oligoflexia bacterium]HMR25356.1 hypothetical protein [Oligoflexia bacterium]
MKQLKLIVLCNIFIAVLCEQPFSQTKAQTIERKIVLWGTSHTNQSLGIHSAAGCPDLHHKLKSFYNSSSSKNEKDSEIILGFEGVVLSAETETLRHIEDHILIEYLLYLKHMSIQLDLGLEQISSPFYSRIDLFRIWDFASTFLTKSPNHPEIVNIVEKILNNDSTDEFRVISSDLIERLKSSPQSPRSEDMEFIEKIYELTDANEFKAYALTYFEELKTLNEKVVTSFYTTHIKNASEAKYNLESNNIPALKALNFTSTLEFLDPVNLFNEKSSKSDETIKVEFEMREHFIFSNIQKLALDYPNKSLLIWTGSLHTKPLAKLISETKLKDQTYVFSASTGDLEACDEDFLRDFLRGEDYTFKTSESQRLDNWLANNSK